MELKRFAVRMALGDGFRKTVEVCAPDGDSAMRAAEYAARERFEGSVSVSVEEIEGPGETGASAFL